ncbi:molybdopterin molybdenumtransferase MoeA [Bacterioplanes sanyensis]|uniref:molybdopterin molybdotransferase MoeA n=1 Tax=Bacterioplanes sanyensis TaxID=1249553 RepID=UPI001675F3CF|nr:gephyrin-like molybdotransferase Glp [Bacterioplanes sanyensis]GGY46629.1 molybdopterin molybdenumtransferase MoeA [Bacterioplanes sanyensis]
MSLCDQPGLTPLEQALAHLAERVSVVAGVEKLTLLHADGRVLSEDIVSPVDVPPTDNSAMDGFALHGEGSSWNVVGEALAGHPYMGPPLQPGQCIRIMTGASLPKGADRVVMQEYAELQDATLQVQQIPGSGDNIRRQAGDIRQGSKLLTAGTRLGPAELGLLASVGVTHVSVIRRPVAAVFSTGDELAEAGQQLGAGQIYDSNAIMVVTLLQRMGCEVLNLGRVADDEAALQQLLAEADLKADLVVTSGGVSVGEADYTRRVVEAMGELELWRLAIKPGKPFAFGRLQNSWFMGLPGNPVSALVTLHQLGAEVVRLLSGASPHERVRLPATAAEDIVKTPGRLDFQRGVYWLSADGVQAKALPRQNSQVLSAVAEANCYIVLEQERGSVIAGETIVVEPFDGSLRGMC